uniref:Uncharacterized protein n=1 Tax=Tetranychus urticae TaxID=32264 RepID=T1K175_TETUR
MTGLVGPLIGEDTPNLATTIVTNPFWTKKDAQTGQIYGNIFVPNL